MRITRLPRTRPAKLVVTPARDIAADQRLARGVAAAADNGSGGGLSGRVEGDGASVLVPDGDAPDLLQRLGDESARQLRARGAVTVHGRGSTGAFVTMPKESSPKQRTRQPSACSPMSCKQH